MSTKADAFASAIDAHDALVAAAGLELWMGGEPTFTDRMSFAPEWNADAAGDDKHARGRRATALLAARTPGAALLRTLGRQYPEEDVPRWSYGVYARRDSAPVWHGPADPIAGGGSSTDADLARFRDALIGRLNGRALVVDAPLPVRIVVGDIPLDPSAEPALARTPWQLAEVPATGPVDELATRGVLMIACGLDEGAVRVELPAYDTVPAFLTALVDVANAANDAGLAGLIVGGFPPPVDESIEWTTVTPDPGVLELNMAPQATVGAYARETAAAHQLARELGLEPLRLYFNGDLADSGGGGQLTFGGPSPERSPFFAHPHLLPRLVTYLNRHPSMSYWLGLDAVGGSSQAPRADEGARETFEELGVALDALRAEAAPSPTVLWESLAPLLTDRFGNSHRAEINVEKLWNPHLPMRGQLGLVEFRALRMARNPQRAAATAVLLRSLLAYLATHDYDEPVLDWGGTLHDRFALPFYTERDLGEVLAELEGGGFGVGDAIAAELLDDSDWQLCTAPLGLARVTLRNAREFWPLLGDLSQEAGTHRLVDPSSRRVELAIHAEDSATAAAWTLAVDGHTVPLVDELTPTGVARVIGIRHRSFVPQPGLHPLVPAHGPLVLEFTSGTSGIRITLHAWSPDGSAYDGLPASPADAAARRAARCVVEPFTPSATPPPPAPRRALSPHAIDTRRLPR